MASMAQHSFGLATYLPKTYANEPSAARTIYDENRHHVYSLCFWMTDNELAAEELMYRVFRRAFAECPAPFEEGIDRALIAELRDMTPLGQLSLQCQAATEIADVRRNTLRVHLERAVVQLPATEKLIFLLHDVESYDRERIASCLKLSTEEVQYGLHQARLRIRELLSRMRR